MRLPLLLLHLLLERHLSRVILLVILLLFLHRSRSGQILKDTHYHSKLLATLTTCQCFRIHQFHILRSSTALEVSLPSDNKDKELKDQDFHPSKDPRVTWLWNGGQFTLRLAPCWIYHLLDNGQVRLIQRCEKTRHQQNMTLQEKMLALENVTAIHIVQLAKEHKEPFSDWSKWIAVRLGGIQLRDLIKICDTLSLKKKRKFFSDCFDKDLIHCRTREIPLSLLSALSKTLSPPLPDEVEGRLIKLTQAPYTLAFD